MLKLLSVMTELFKYHDYEHYSNYYCTDKKCNHSFFVWKFAAVLAQAASALFYRCNAPPGLMFTAPRAGARCTRAPLNRRRNIFSWSWSLCLKIAFLAVKWRIFWFFGFFDTKPRLQITQKPTAVNLSIFSRFNSMDE